LNTDLTDLIERIDLFEERLGARLEGLYAELDDDGYLTVNGELHAASGSTITKNIYVHMTVHDDRGRLLQTCYTIMLAEDFFAFEPFSQMIKVAHPIVSPGVVYEPGRLLG